MRWSDLSSGLFGSDDAPEPILDELTIEVPGTDGMAIGWSSGDRRFAIHDQPAHGLSRADLIILQSAISEILSATEGL